MSLGRTVGAGAAFLVFLGSVVGVGYGLSLTQYLDSAEHRAGNSLADIGVAMGVGITAFFALVAVVSFVAFCALRLPRQPPEPRYPEPEGDVRYM